MDCKQALTEAKGDLEQAVVILRKKGVSVAAKKATRVTSEGSVTSYIHAGGKIGVLVEVNCESDFVARTEDFKELVHDIAMHIAASDPKFVRKEDVTKADFEREKEIYLAQAVASRPDLIDGIGVRVLSGFNSIRGKPADVGLDSWRETLAQLESVSMSRRTLGVAAFWGASVLRQVSRPIYTAWLNQRLESGTRATCCR